MIERIALGRSRQAAVELEVAAVEIIYVHKHEIVYALYGYADYSVVFIERGNRFYRVVEDIAEYSVKIALTYKRQLLAVCNA